MAQQYIGSRISLISKSDIRYRGVLHSIDPAAATVSLEQVRSMGTEGRKSNPSEEIAPTDTLYEFIVFRAADVKDLSIEAPAEPKPEPPKPSVPDDPAIMSTTAPPRNAPNPFMQAPNMMAMPQGMYNNAMPPMMYPPGTVPPQWPPYMMPPPGQIHPMMGFPHQPVAPPTTGAHETNNQSSQPNQPSTTKPPLAAGNTSASPHPSKSTEPQGNQKASPLPTGATTKQPSSSASNLASTQASGVASQATIPSSQARGANTVNGVAGKSVFGATTAMDMMNTIAAMNPQQGAPHSQNNIAHQKHDSSANATKNLHAPPSGNQGADQSLGNGTLPSTSQSQHQQMRHPLPQVPNKSKAGVKPHPGQSTSHKTDQGSRHQAPSAPIVPAQDFDFASANAKFNKPVSNNQNQSENSNGQKENAGSASGATTDEKTNDADDDFVIPEAPPGTYYDKKKSFFDDISSEVKERLAISQDPGKNSANNSSIRGARGGRGGRGKGWDRNAERQKNVDTFGDVALNPNLGALGSGYNGYGRGGINRMGQMGGVMNGYRGMGGRGRGHGRGHGGRGGFGMNVRGAAPSGMIPSSVNRQAL